MDYKNLPSLSLPSVILAGCLQTVGGSTHKAIGKIPVHFRLYVNVYDIQRTYLFPYRKRATLTCRRM
jgi:hypothetical protein